MRSICKHAKVINMHANFTYSIFNDASKIIWGQLRSKLINRRHEIGWLLVKWIWTLFFQRDNVATEIPKYLRFDDKNTRAARLVTDRCAMISEIFDKFVKNSIASYTPGENITVDEQLFPTKARCRFTQYMANKPDKFGIKFWVGADVETKYMLPIPSPYLGKDSSRPSMLSCVCSSLSREREEMWRQTISSPRCKWQTIFWRTKSRVLLQNV